MRTLDYIDLFNATAHRARLPLDATGLALADSAEFTALRTLHSDRLATIWDHHFWPDLCQVQKRYFRDAWSAATVYAAAAEVVYPGPQKYYQALRASTNQAPSTLSGTVWTTNTSYWAESAASYSAAAYDATHTYTRGDQAYNPVTDRVYQLYAATSTGNPTTDATKWGVLTPFDRYIAYEQTGQTAFDHAIAAWDQNPRVTQAACELLCDLSNNGLQVRDDVYAAYLEFRPRCPILTGNVYSATATYAVGDQIYYASTTKRGNFWDVTDVPGVGDTPDSSPLEFSVVEIPHAFRKYLLHGAAGDYLLPAEGESAASELALAAQELERLTSLYFAQLAHRRPNTTAYTR